MGASAVAQAQRRGNVIFLHPDGTGLGHWHAARIFWKGPDGELNWDKMSELAVYRGHMADQLSGTSNGGATTHAFGYKVSGPGSFGRDGGGDTARPIRSLSGYPGSLMREAAAAGMPIGVINDGNIGEPGTGAFLAEVRDRGDWDGIALQILKGRPEAKDPAPAVILGGGERNFLPKGAQGVHGLGQRADLRDLVTEAKADGYEVVRTRAEFDSLKNRLRFDPRWSPKVLGLFAEHHTFNDETEEVLLSRSMVSATPDPKLGRLILWGGLPGTAGFNPPTFAEMTELGLMVLERHSAKAKKPFFLVTEPESTDNMGNEDNAVGTLEALKRADDAIGVMLAFIERKRNTLLITAADSDAGGPQVAPAGRTGRGSASINPTNANDAVVNPVDGLEGRNSEAFVSAPDQYGVTMRFHIAWAGTNDFPGGIITRAHGMNADLLRTRFRSRFDNVDVYRMMFATLFGRMPEYPQGKRAADR
jgi:alkaline phosphatase